MEQKGIAVKLATGLIAFGMLMSFVLPSTMSVALANQQEEIKENWSVEVKEPINEVLESSISLLNNPYEREEIRSREILQEIEEKYAPEEDFNEEQVIEITPEMEQNMEAAVNEYLRLSGFNPRLRRLGRNWWNSRGFVGGVLDAAFIAIGFGAARLSNQALMQLIRANRRNITRVIESKIAIAMGLRTGAWVGTALEIVGVLAGVSLGGAIAWGIDYVDGKRLDGYIFA